MIRKNYFSNVTLNKIRRNLCLIFMIIVALNAFKFTQCYNKNNDKASATLHSSPNNNRIRYQQLLMLNQNRNKQQRRQDGQQHQQQRVMSSDDYEKLSESEMKAINNNFEEQTKSVVTPSKETNGNSQVVFVNFSRVVSDGNKKRNN